MIEFIDADGIPVLASLNLDQSGRPFELDMFKADSSKLIRIPASLIGMVGIVGDSARS